MSLSYTWRNPVAVLNVANALVSPLSAALRAKPNGIQVDILKGAGRQRGGRVEAVMAETIAEEAGAVAAWFAERLSPGGDASGAIALPCRRDMEFFAEVLREHGVKAACSGSAGSSPHARGRRRGQRASGGARPPRPEASWCACSL